MLGLGSWAGVIVCVCMCVCVCGLRGEWTCAQGRLVDAHVGLRQGSGPPEGHVHPQRAPEPLHLVAFAAKAISKVLGEVVKDIFQPAGRLRVCGRDARRKYAA